MNHGQPPDRTELPPTDGELPPTSCDGVPGLCELSAHADDARRVFPQARGQIFLSSPPTAIGNFLSPPAHVGLSPVCGPNTLCGMMGASESLHGRSALQIRRTCGNG